MLPNHRTPRRCASIGHAFGRVFVLDPEYDRVFVGFVLDRPNLPDIASWGKAVAHLDMTNWRFGVIALGAGIAERRRALA
jgi:hypothetical protein